MSHDQDNEGFAIERTDPIDDDVAPGRSVFGDDNVSFEADDAAVPHWSAPPTGRVPKVEAPAASITFDPRTAPLQHEQPQMHSQTQPPPSQPPLIGGDDTSGWAAETSQPTWAGEQNMLPPRQPNISTDVDADAFFAHSDDDVGAPDQTERSPLSTAFGVNGGGDRNIFTATIVGLGLAALILAAMAYREWVAVAIITVALGVAAVEFFNAVRVANLHPAVLLGLTSVVAMPPAVYWRGESAAGLVLMLSVVFGGIWYVVVAPNDSPIRGLGSTVLGILHIGLLGSYAALMLSIPVHGTGLLTAAIIVTVAYDTGGFVVGRTMGRSPLSPASPNKTLEGLIGGVVAAIAAAFVMGWIEQPSPLADTAFGGGLGTMMILGAAAAIVAPLGDLAESLIKRDLGIKDMGSILPGHGGVLDRFDSLLFVLPTTFYVSRFVLT